MPCEHFEVSVSVQDRCVGGDGDAGDEAVNELPGSLTGPTADSVERGRFLIVDRLGWQEGRAGQQPSEVMQVTLVARTGEQLHSDGVARGDVAGQKLIYAPAD